MSERFTIGAQGAGFISFKEAITVSGSQDFDIPEGMICIGGNGRGYVIEEQTYIPSPTLTLGVYVLYASDPVNAAGEGNGIAIIDHQSYTSYINGAGHPSPSRIFHGDTNSRRAFCYFEVNFAGNVVASSIRTLTNFAYEEQYDYLEKMGFFVFGKNDSDFQFRGNYWDEDCTLAITTAGSTYRSWETTNGITTGFLVYKENFAAWTTQAYVAGDKIVESSTGTHREWEVVTPNTSSGSEPTWSTVTTIGDTITDSGGVVWSLTGSAYGYYDVAQADNATYPDREIVVGVADEDRDGTAAGDNYVISSGFVDLGETMLPNTEFPAGTYLYLTEDALHITTNRPSVQTSAGAISSFISAGNIVRDIDFWMNGKTYTIGDLIVDDSSPTQYVWRCTTGGVANGVGGNVPDFSGSVTPIIYEWSDGGYVGDTVAEDSGVTWTLEGEYNQQDFKGRKVRVGVSLGYGKMLFQPGAGGSANIDDHDESANAHSDIQDAINEAGIYVYNQSQGVTDFIYRGQMFDKYATFDTVAPVVDYDLVYLKASDGKYYQAANVSSNLDAGGVCGMAYGVSGGSGTVLAGGFIRYNTSSWNDGDTLYLTTGGAMTNSATGPNNITVGKVIKAATIVLGGYILLQLGGGSGVSTDYADYSVHEGQTISGVSSYDLVYRSTTPDYRQAINDQKDLTTSRVVGMAYDVNGTNADIITQGFVDYNFTVHCDTSPSAGDSIYLSTDTAGNTTSTRANGYNIRVGTCITAGAGGILLLDIDFEDDYTIDSNATFLGVTDDHVAFVYRNSNGDYRLSVNDNTDLAAGKVIGLSHKVDTNEGAVITHGFVTFNTTSANTYCDDTCAVGDTLYLSPTTPGGVTKYANQTNNIKVGTVITAGASGIIYVNISDIAEFQDNAVDYEADFSASVSQYDIVYGTDGGGGVIEYEQAIADGTVAEVFLGVASEVDTQEGIVISQGYVDMGSASSGTSSGAGTLKYLVDTHSLGVGEKVYLSTITAGLLSKDQTTAEVGKYVGVKTIGGTTHYIMLLSSTGGGGTGDVTAEDLTYLNLLENSPYGLIYYDIFAEVSSLTYTANVTYAANTSSYTFNSATDSLGEIIIAGDESAYAVNTAYNEGDTVYDEVTGLGWIWECLVPGTTHQYYTPEFDFIGVSSSDFEAFYTMDNKDGTLAVGQTIPSEIDNGTDHKMTITGAAVTEDSSGKSDNAFVFDGTAYLLNADSTGTELGDTLGTADPLSVSFWFRVDTFPTAGNYAGLFEIGTGSADGVFSVYLSDNDILFDVGGSNVGSYGFTDTLSYHHVYAEYDGTASGTAKLYLDGVEVISNSASTDPVCTGKNVYIANFYDTANTTLAPFTGRIDEFRIYSRVLTSTELYYLKENSGETVYMGSRITDKGGTVVWEAVRPRTDYRFFISHDSDATALLTVEYSTDYTGTDLTTGSWTDITTEVFDTETIVDTSGFTKLAVKFTGDASSNGDLNSFGVLYGFNDAERYSTNNKLEEVYTNGTGLTLTTGDVIIIPNSGHYPVGANSLKVTTLSGVRLFEGNSYHYVELNERSIMLKDFILPDGDSIVFECDYGDAIDSSTINHSMLLVEHDVDPLSGNYGSHKLEDANVPGQEYKPEVQSGSLVLVPL